MVGSERVGYRVSGEDCDATSLWENNVAHSCVIGVAMFPGDCENQGRDCAKLTGFTAWKSGSFGFYHQVSAGESDPSLQFIPAQGRSFCCCFRLLIQNWGPYFIVPASVWRHFVGVCLFAQVDCSVEMENIVAAENLVGIFNMVIHPDARSHAYAYKYGKISNSLIVGTTSEFDCNADVLPDVSRLQNGYHFVHE